MSTASSSMGLKFFYDSWSFVVVSFLVLVSKKRQTEQQKIRWGGSWQIGNAFFVVCHKIESLLKILEPKKRNEKERMCTYSWNEWAVLQFLLHYSPYVVGLRAVSPLYYTWPIQPHVLNCLLRSVQPINVNLHLLVQYVWKCTVEKSQTSVTKMWLYSIVVYAGLGPRRPRAKLSVALYHSPVSSAS